MAYSMRRTASTFYNIDYCSRLTLKASTLSFMPLGSQTKIGCFFQISRNFTFYLFSTFAQLALASSKTSSTVDDKQLFLATIIIFSRKPAWRKTPSQRCPQLKNLFWPVSIFFKFQKNYRKLLREKETGVAKDFLTKNNKREKNNKEWHWLWKRGFVQERVQAWVGERD